MKNLFTLIALLLTLHVSAQTYSHYVGTDGTTTTWNFPVDTTMTYDSSNAFLPTSTGIIPVVTNSYILGSNLYVTVLDSGCMCPIRRLRGNLLINAWFH
jgi:hypothetical protein